MTLTKTLEKIFQEKSYINIVWIDNDHPRLFLGLFSFNMPIELNQDLSEVFYQSFNKAIDKTYQSPLSCLVDSSEHIVNLDSEFKSIKSSDFSERPSLLIKEKQLELKVIIVPMKRNHIEDSLSQQFAEMSALVTYFKENGLFNIQNLIFNNSTGSLNIRHYYDYRISKYPADYKITIGHNQIIIKGMTSQTFNYFKPSFWSFIKNPRLLIKYLLYKMSTTLDQESEPYYGESK